MIIRSRALVLMAIFGLLISTASADVWWDTDWAYRVTVNVSAGSYSRTNVVISKTVNFTDLFRSVGETNPFDINSIRIIESITYNELPFQFDQGLGFDASNNAFGELLWIMDGSYSSGAIKNYYIYFDTSAYSKSAPTYDTSWGAVDAGSDKIYNEVLEIIYETDNYHPGIDRFLLTAGHQCKSNVANSIIDGTRPDAQDWSGVSPSSTSISDGAVKKEMRVSYSGSGYNVQRDITMYKSNPYIYVELTSDASIVQINFRGTPGGDNSDEGDDSTESGTISGYDYRGAYDDANGQGYEMVVDRSYIDVSSWQTFDGGDRYGFDVNSSGSDLNYYVIGINSGGASEISAWAGRIINPVLSSFSSVEKRAVCGDQICESAKGETEANCWSDCHASICGDGNCEEGEEGDCPTDCSVQIAFQLPYASEQFSRGDTLPIKVKITNPKGADIQDATVSCRIDFPGMTPITLYDDGAHDDAFADDAIYGSEIVISGLIPEGSYIVNVSASKWGNWANETRTIIVNKSLATTFSSDNSTYYKGYDIQLAGAITSLQGLKKENMSLVLNFTSGTWNFHTEIQTDENGEFEYTYPIYFSDPDGEWKISINGYDDINNSVQQDIYVNVITPSQLLYYGVFFSAMPGSSYKRGSEIPISVYVRKGDNPISSANVSYRDPDGVKRYLSEVSTGVYEDIYSIPLNATLGVWSLAIQATKYEGDTLQAGASVPLLVEIEPMSFEYTLIEPTQFQFVAGEQINIVISLRFENGTPVTGAIVTSNNPSGGNLIFDEQDIPGYYGVSYSPTNLENGSWSLSIKAQDISGNLATINREILIRESIPLIPPWGWILIISVIMGTLVYWKVQGETRFYVWRYDKLKKEKDRVESMKGIVEERYFNRRIDEETYTKLMRDYEEQSVDVLSKVAQIKEKIKKSGKEDKLTKKQEKPKKKKEKKKVDDKPVEKPEPEQESIPEDEPYKKDEEPEPEKEPEKKPEKKDKDGKTPEEVLLG